MNWVQMWAEGNALVIELGSPGQVNVQSFTQWWRYFWKENAQRAIDAQLPHAWVKIDMLRIV